MAPNLSTAGTAGTLTPSSRWWPRQVDPIVALAVLALVVRAGTRIIGGPTAMFAFDEGAYLSASSLVGRGHLLYSDVAAAHPPLYFIVMAPFTWFGTPSQTIVVARLASAFMAAASTWIVGDTVRRHRSVAGGVAAAAVYAVLPEALAAERSVLIEPLLNLLLLGAARAWLLAPEGSARIPAVGRRGGAVPAGVMWGCAVACKLSGFVLAVPIAATSLLRRRPQRAVSASIAAVATVSIVLAPFLLGAAEPFVDQVIRFQLGRAAEGVAVSERFGWIWGIGGGRSALRALFGTTIVLFGVVALAADLRRRVAPIDELLVFGLVWYVTVVVSIVLAPVSFLHYAALLAPSIALVAGAVGHRFGARQVASVGFRRGPALVLVAVLVVGVVLLVASRPGSAGAESDRIAEEQAAVSRLVREHRGCLWSWEPEWLILGDRLPDVELFGAPASEPFVAEVGAAVAAGEPGADFGGRRSVSRAALDRCPFVLARPESWLPLTDTHRIVAETVEGGPLLWERRR